VVIKFGRAFAKKLNNIKVPELDSYLKGVSTQGRTRNNHLNTLKMFFRWAQEWGRYVPEGTLEISKLRPYKEVQSGIEVFTPEEMRRLLELASDDLRPYLALGAFAGARSAELMRLKWEDIDLEAKTIHLGASITKTRRRRLARMPENLVEWLKSHPGKKTGVIFSKPLQLSRTRLKLCEKIGFNWKKNALRRSYISYRMAQPEGDAIQVSKQCGNSVEMVETNYKELVSPSMAEEWFSLTPKKCLAHIPSTT
jgi:integrase